jgi:hypothetical protein
MNNMNHINRNLICFILVFWAYGVHAATLPPDPDNAALLYYQAFLLLPDPNMNLINPVLDGAEPDEKVREYIEHAHKAIELAEAAAKIPGCTWGMIYSQGLGANLPQLEQCHYLTNILNVEARILTADGEYHAALEKCLTIHRLAQHIGSDALLSYVLSLDVDTNAQNCIKYILGIMPSDIDILIWLQNQLFLWQGSSLTLTQLAHTLEMDFQLKLQSIRINPTTISLIRDQLMQNPGSIGNADYILNLTDEDIVVLAGEPYNDFLNSVIRVLGSEMPYEEKYTELQSLTEDLEAECSSYPAVVQLVICCADCVLPLYSQNIRQISRMNALRAAVEIYIILSQTGRIPETLPANLPKDPFSGQDFEYEITENGFILRCRAKDIFASKAIQPPGTDSDVVHEYEFEVQM